MLCVDSLSFIDNIVSLQVGVVTAVTLRTQRPVVTMKVRAKTSPLMEEKGEQLILISEGLV